MLGEDRFCPRCASALEPREVEGKKRLACSQCGNIHYLDPKVAATSIVERNGKVLMVRRATEPGLGLWSLPGGYVDRGEHVEAAAAREFLEETGLEVNVTALVGVFSEASHPVILVAYDSQIAGGDLKPGSEVMELDFFSLEHLPSLAFPRDHQILEGWRRLKNGHNV